MKRPLIAFALAAASALALPGCLIVQGSYDSHARNECGDIADPEDRLICERAVLDAQQERRAEALREN